MNAQLRSVRMQLGDVAAAYLRDQITSGNLVAGAPVRPETIADELGISTTPAREALQALRAEGFLDLAPRRGFTVASLDGNEQYADAAGIAELLRRLRDTPALRRLYDSILFVEQPVARKTALEVSMAELAALKLEITANIRRRLPDRLARQPVAAQPEFQI